MNNSSKNSDHEKRISEPIVKNEVSVKEKTKFDEFINLFVPNDVEDIKKYIVKDKIIPSVKGLIWDICNAFLSSILGNDLPSNRSGYSNARGSVGYDHYYRLNEVNNRSRLSESASRVYDYENLIMRTRAEALEVLNELRNLESQYRNVRVADYYEAAGRGTKFTDYDYGWSIDLGNDLRNADVYYVGGPNGGYTIKLPRALPLLK